MRSGFRSLRLHAAALLAVSVPAAVLAPPATAEPLPRPERPLVSEVRPVLDHRDEAAALEAVQFALSEVGDGSTFVFHRHGGLLSGAVQPTQSFKDFNGRVCRYLVVTLSDHSRQRRAEGIACRLADGIWQLEG